MKLKINEKNNQKQISKLQGIHETEKEVVLQKVDRKKHQNIKQIKSLIYHIFMISEKRRLYKVQKLKKLYKLAGIITTCIFLIIFGLFILNKFLEHNSKKTEFDLSTTITSTPSEIYGGPDESYLIVKSIEKNYPLKQIGNYNNWIEVELVTGEKGWISNKNVKIKEKKVIVTRKTEIHLNNNTESTLLTIANIGEFFTPLEEKDGWYKILFKSKIYGWINTSDVLKLKYPFVYVDKSSANIMKFADRGSDRITTAKEGVRLIPIDEVEKWLFIQLPGGEKGWIEKKSVTRQNYPNIKVIRETEAYKKPTVTSTPIATLSKNDDFFVLEKRKYWRKISIDGDNMGWVADNYIEEIIKGNLEVRVESYLRMGPGHDYRIIEIIKGKEKVKWIAEGKDWNQVQTLSNQIGWIQKDLTIKIVPEESRIVFTLDKVNVQLTPGSHYSIVNVVQPATDLEVLRTEGEWHYVRLQDGTKGFILKKSVFEY